MSDRKYICIVSFLITFILVITACSHQPADDAPLSGPADADASSQVHSTFDNVASQTAVTDRDDSSVGQSPAGSVIHSDGTSNDTVTLDDVTDTPVTLDDTTDTLGTSDDTTDTPGTLDDATDTPGTSDDTSTTSGSSDDVTDTPGTLDDVTDTPGAADDTTDTDGTGSSEDPAESSVSAYTVDDSLFCMDSDARRSFASGLEASTEIPTLCIYTENAEPVLSRDDYVGCIVDVINCDEIYRLTSAPAGIRLRGNSSSFYGNRNRALKDQVPYRIRFEEKTSLLGLNDAAKCKSWVLLKDESGIISNDVIFRLGRKILGPDNYCSDGTLVHVYINNEFKGNFQLCEQSQVNKHRVDIGKVDTGYQGTDIGYLVEIDNYADEEHPYFRMEYAKASATDANGLSRPFEVAFYSIKSDIYSEEQRSFIKKYVNNVFKIIYDAAEAGVYNTLDANGDIVPSAFDNPRDAINAVFDIDAAINVYILHEIAMSNDCGEGSFFMSADFSPNSRSHKLKFTCPWDFDWSGNKKDSLFAGVFRSDDFVDVYGDRSNPWFILLANQDWFRQEASVRLNKLIASGLLEAALQEEEGLLELYHKDLNCRNSGKVDEARYLIKRLRQRIDWLAANL